MKLKSCPTPWADVFINRVIFLRKPDKTPFFVDFNERPRRTRQNRDLFRLLSSTLQLTNDLIWSNFTSPFILGLCIFGVFACEQMAITSQHKCQCLVSYNWLQIEPKSGHLKSNQSRKQKGVHQSIFLLFLITCLNTTRNATSSRTTAHQIPNFHMKPEKNCHCHFATARHTHNQIHTVNMAKQSIKSTDNGRMRKSQTKTKKKTDHLFKAENVFG